MSLPTTPFAPIPNGSGAEDTDPNVWAKIGSFSPRWSDGTLNVFKNTDEFYIVGPGTASPPGAFIVSLGFAVESEFPSGFRLNLRRFYNGHSNKFKFVYAWYVKMIPVSVQLKKRLQSLAIF
jgi:hypothetical protein